MSTHTRIEEDLHTGKERTTERRRVHGGDAPDLALTVMLPDGSTPVRRQLIALNFGGRKIGTVQEPVRVVLPPTFRWPGDDTEPRQCQAEAQAVQQAREVVGMLRLQLRQLQERLDRASPAERKEISEEIRDIRRQQLPAAVAALDRAQHAYDRCRALARASAEDVFLGRLVEVRPQVPSPGSAAASPTEHLTPMPPRPQQP